MVDVGGKAATRRSATAAGTIQLTAAAFALLEDGSPKGEVFGAARLAAIAAAKRTAEWIPLCHLLALDKVQAEFETDSAQQCIHCRVHVSATAKTGVEMEALVGVQAALLTLYDMLKAADKGMVMGNVRLLEKRGGSSGDFTRGG